MRRKRWVDGVRSDDWVVCERPTINGHPFAVMTPEGQALQIQDTRRGFPVIGRWATAKSAMRYVDGAYPVKKGGRDGRP
jgi:hypothetical protein